MSATPGTWFSFFNAKTASRERMNSENNETALQKQALANQGSSDVQEMRNKGQNANTDLSKKWDSKIADQRIAGDDQLANTRGRWGHKTGVDVANTRGRWGLDTSNNAREGAWERTALQEDGVNSRFGQRLAFDAKGREIAQNSLKGPLTNRDKNMFRNQQVAKWIDDGWTGEEITARKAELDLTLWPKSSSSGGGRQRSLSDHFGQRQGGSGQAEPIQEAPRAKLYNIPKNRSREPVQYIEDDNSHSKFIGNKSGKRNGVTNFGHWTQNDFK